MIQRIKTILKLILALRIQRKITTNLMLMILKKLVKIATVRMKLMRVTTKKRPMKMMIQKIRTAKSMMRAIVALRTRKMNKNLKRKYRSQP